MARMSIDEAIAYCEKIAAEKCDECGKEHKQLAEWLKDYKRLKEQELNKQKQTENRYSGLSGGLQYYIDRAKSRNI